MANLFVGENAMSAFLDPINNFLTTTRPKEAHTNIEQSFVEAKMPTGGAAVKNVHDQRAEADRHNDQEQGVTRLQALADNEAPVVQAQIVVASKLLEGWM
jgi:hypothetical protein